MESGRKRTLRTGHGMPLIGLGTWQLTKNTSETVQRALGYGYRMIDTSGDYGTQPGIGEALQLTPVPRSDIFLVTKVEETDDAYKATKKNLAELQQNYVDLMLIHRPPKQGSGEDLWQGLIRAKAEGLTRDIGVSNYSIAKINDLIKSSGIVPVVNQIEWSPFGHSNEMQDFADEHRIVIQAYSPLTRAERLLDPTLIDIAEHYNKSTAQILIRWNIQGGTVPLPKSNNLNHLQENIQVFDFEINEDDMEALNDLNEAYSSLGSLPYVTA